MDFEKAVIAVLLKMKVESSDEQKKGSGGSLSEYEKEKALRDDLREEEAAAAEAIRDRKAKGKKGPVEEEFDAESGDESKEHRAAFADTRRKPFLAKTPELLSLPDEETNEELMQNILRDQAALREKIRTEKKRLADEKASSKGRGRGRGRGRGKKQAEAAAKEAKETPNEDENELPGLDARMESEDAQMKVDRALEDEDEKNRKNKRRKTGPKKQPAKGSSTDANTEEKEEENKDDQEKEEEGSGSKRKAEDSE